MKTTLFAATWLLISHAVHAQNYTVSLPYCPVPGTEGNGTSGGAGSGIPESTT